MDPFINVLEKNWYDSQQALQTLTLNDYDKFEIPRRLSAIIMEKIGVRQQQPQQQQFQNYPQQQSNQYNQYGQYGQQGGYQNSGSMM